MSQSITYTEANENVMPISTIPILREQIIAFCRKNHIKQFGLFGSVLRKDLNQDSDIDVLVEFAPGHVPGLAFFTMQDELSALFERYVDLNTPDFLSPYFREQVRKEALTLYAS